MTLKNLIIFWLFIRYTRHIYSCKFDINCLCGLDELYNKYDMEMNYWQDFFCTHDKTEEKGGITFCVICKVIRW